VRAITFERYGGPDVLELREVPEPSPGEGQALVEVEAAGVNYRDVYERERHDYGSEPPAIIGVEGAGIVAESRERVAWAGVPGSYAEWVAADRGALVPIPDRMPTETAAAALLQGLTAGYLAFDSYPIEAGDWVVVHAAAGGVGLLLTQFARLRGGTCDRHHVDGREGGPGARSGCRGDDRIRRFRRARARDHRRGGGGGRVRRRRAHHVLRGA
jgi:NADPH2:quinone reductase